MSVTSVLMPLLAFAFVVALIPLALWLIRRSGVAAQRDAGLMRSIGTMALSPSQRIVIVEVGSGSSARWMVLGVSPERIVNLLTLDAEPSAVGPGEPAPETLVEQLISRWSGAFDGGRYAR